MLKISLFVDPVMNEYTVRCKGENLWDVLSFIFIEDKDGNKNKDIFKQKIDGFEQELKDPKFDTFYKQINSD